MRIMIPLVLELPEGGGEVEGVERLVLEAGRQALVAAMRASEDGVTACPHCGCQALRREGTDERVALTVFGRVTLCPRRVRCGGCRRRFRRGEAWFAALGGGNVTPELARYLRRTWARSAVSIASSSYRCRIISSVAAAYGPTPGSLSSSRRKSGVGSSETRSASRSRAPEAMLRASDST